MTPADWEYAFKTLLDLHLIRVPNDYYDEKLYFKDPDELTKKFSKLEDENLQMIHH